MPRKILLSLLFACALSAAAEVVPMPRLDAGAVSVTNGESTLVAWTSMWSVYAQQHQVYMRLLDSPYDRNAIYIGRGHGPSVATNGRQYLIGHSFVASRFGVSNPYDNALVQLVSPEGAKIGTPRAISHSLVGGLRAVAWNGTHWLVTYYTSAGSPGEYVAFLDESLNIVANVPLMAAPIALHEIDGRWWVFTDDSFSLDAIELRPDGSTGAHFSTTSIGRNVHFTEGPSPLLLYQEGWYSDPDKRIVAQPFDPFTGFGTRRTFLAGSRLIDSEPVDGGSLVLAASSDTRYDTIFVSAGGDVSPQFPLFEAPLFGYYTLGSSKNGPLLYITQNQMTDQGDLYAYPIAPSRAPIDEASGQLISQMSVVRSKSRGARH